MLAAIQGRLERLRVTGDPGSVLGPEAEAEATQLLELVGDPVRDQEAAQPLGWLSWRRYQLSPEEEWSDLLLAAYCLVGSTGNTILEDPDEQLLFRHLLEAIDLFDSYQRTGDLHTLREAIRLFRQALRAFSAEDTTGEYSRVRGVISKDLSRALRSLFGLTGDLAAVDEAIQLARDAVADTWPNHPERAVRQTDLALALQARFGRARDQASLNEAIDLFQKALDATPPDDPDRAPRLSNLALATENQLELERAIDLFRQALDATPPDHPDRAERLSNLGHALQVRSRLTGYQASLYEAIGLFRQAVDATPADHPQRAGRLSNLALVLQARFGQTGDQASLYEARRLFREAVYATPTDDPDRAERLSNLALAEESWFERTGDLAVLTEAIGLFRQAVDATPADHPQRAGRLSNLALVLQARFAQTGDLASLTEAGRLLRLALAAAPSLDSPHHAAIANNLEETARRLRDLSPVFRVSVRYPRRLSMGYTARFLVQIYPPTRERSALRRGDATFGDIPTTRTGDNVQFPGTDVELELSCPAMKFNPSVRKHIPPSGDDVTFWGQPVESARPGKHSGRLAVRSLDDGSEYHSIPFEVDIADYAFDHISRPVTGRIIATALGIVSAVAFVFGLATQTHLVIGLVASGVSGALSAFLATRVTALYRRPSIAMGDTSDSRGLRYGHPVESFRHLRPEDRSP